MQPMSEQEEFNERLEAKGFNLAPKSEFAALLREKENPSSLKGSFDPIASAIERHPGLTREKAEAMAEAFGF